MIRFLYFLVLFVYITGLLNAGEVRGKISDSINNELLVGCTVYIPELQLGVVSGLDGSYVLKSIPKGSYSIVISYIGYSKIEQKLNVSDDNSRLTLNFLLLPENELLSEITVTAHVDRSTDKSARLSEKNSLNIINVMSAKSIELSPDLNVAAVIGRMSGVTLERGNSGEGQYAILRGMDKRYNYTLVNGVKIPSPNNKHRYLPLNIFPSELMDRIEITKTLTADMESDATGGVVDMKMKNAPYKFMVQANGALGYNSRFIHNKFTTYPVENILKESPRELYGKDYSAAMSDFDNGWGKLITKSPAPNGVAGISLGNSFFRQKVGFIVAANYQNTYKGSQSTFFEDEMLQTEEEVRLTSKKERTYSENQTQYGLHSKIDFNISHNHKIEAYNAYIYMQNAQVRQTTSINFKLNYEPEIGNRDLSYQTRIRTTQQDIYVSMLEGNHKFFDKLSMNWIAEYSIANNKVPDNIHINIDNLQQDSVDNIYVDADGSTRRWEHNSDRDITGYLNLKYTLDINAIQLILKSGGVYRNKKRENYYVNYRFKPAGGSQLYGSDFTTLDEIDWTVYTPFGSVGPLVYDAHEKIMAGYFQTQVKASKGYIIAGIRVENTNQGYFQYFPDASDEPYGKQIYTDLFPSIHIKYSPGAKTNLRASYFRSINRPGFFEIVPYQMVNEEYNEYGNKDLKRATIDNIDLRCEYFPSNTEQVLIGVFWKKIKNPIEYAYYTKNYRQYGYGPVNLGDANNIGVELDVIKYIRNWGFKANYTYTHSAITTPKAYYGTDENGNYKRFSQDQTRPLVGQAAHVANLSVMYKNTRHKWDAQLAAAYTGDKIVIASHYLNSDYWREPLVQLDASAEKRFNKGISVFAKINDILNLPTREIIKATNTYNDKFPKQGSDNNTLIREDYYGSSFLIGVRFKM
jgi:hypothetical protein